MTAHKTELEAIKKWHSDITTQSTKTLPKQIKDLKAKYDEKATQSTGTLATAKKDLKDELTEL